MSKSKGFTLIELLVTISIIAMLSIIAIVIYSGFTKNARDQKRIADLKFIQSALEEYYADVGSYPLVSASCTDRTFKVGCPLSSSSSKVYMADIPSDPITGKTYSYITLPSGCNNTTTKCMNYCIYADVEQSSNSKTEASSSCPIPSGVYDYAVTRP